MEFCSATQEKDHVYVYHSGMLTANPTTTSSVCSENITSCYRKGFQRKKVKLPVIYSSNGLIRAHLRGLGAQFSKQKMFPGKHCPNIRSTFTSRKEILKVEVAILQ